MGEQQIEALRERLNKHPTYKDLTIAEILRMEDIAGVDFAIVKFTTGLVQVFSLGGASNILRYGGSCDLWVYECGGEDWVIFKKDKMRITIYWVDNWELILKAIQGEEPTEIIDLSK